MTTQSGGTSGENQLDIKLKYVSEGYQKHVRELQDLITLAKEMKTDLGSIRLPVIKGLKAALREAGELSTAIQSLNRQGSVQAVAPLPKNATKEQEAAYAEAKKIQAADTVVRQAQLEVGEKTLKLQRQLANEAQNELHRKAFLGTLTKEEIRKQAGNLDHLRAIEKGLGESAKVNKKQIALQTEVSKLIEAEVTQRKEAAQKQRTEELRARLEKNKIAAKFARQSLEGNNKGLATYLKTADLNQIKALENAMKAESLKDGYTPTAHSKAFNKMVAKARADITAPKVTLKASDIVSKINAGTFTQAEVNHAVAQLRKQITHATNTGATRDTLVPLHQGLLDIRKAAAEKFIPPSPYQVAKATEEKHAETLLANRFNAQSVQTATKAQIEEQLKASKIMSHPTKAAFGTEKYDIELNYQTLLKNRLQVMKENEKEAKKQEQLSKIRSENRLSQIKQEMKATEDLGQLKVLQRRLNTRLQAEVKADPTSTVIPFAEKLKAQLAEKISKLNVPKEILDLTRQSQDLKVNNAETIKANRQTAAERAAQKALDNDEKRAAIQRGLYNTKEKIADLDSQSLKAAKDTLNFGISTGLITGQAKKDAEAILKVIKDREAHERKISQHNQNIRNLSLTHYKTEADLKNLKKAELDLAQKVIAYRIRNGQLTKEEAIAQQELYNIAKRRDYLLTAQAHRQDAARQHERRLNQLTHLEGDGGASMAVVQAGFMMRSLVLGGLSSIFSGAFESAIQLDKAFRNLQAISASTNYEMATMKINLINVAQASKFSAAEVGETTVLLAQAGLSIQEIGASMKGIITLAQATGTDLAKSVDVVTSVLSIFNKSATETDTIVNQLTAALNRSKLDINKMALGLQYAGNIANDSGVSFEELTAALGATANAGIRSGSTLGTGLRQMFIDLQKPNEKLTKRLETLGVTLDQVNFRSQGLEGVLRNLRNAGFSSADAFETFEVRSAAAFSALSGNLTDFHDLQEELADTNAAFDANNVQMEAFAVQLDHLKSNLGVMAAEGLKPVTAMLRDWTKGLAHSMENAEEGAGIIQLLTGAFAALMAAVTVTWFTRIAGGILSLAKAFAFVGSSLTLTRYGVAGLVAGLAVAVSSWISYRSEVERLNTALDKAKGEHNNLKAALQSSEGTLNNVDEALKNLVDRYGVLKEDSGQTQTAAKNLMTQFEEFGLKIDDVANINIDNLIQKIQDLRSELSKDLKEKISDTATAKVKEIRTERDTSVAELRKSRVLRGSFNTSGLKTFLTSTDPKNLNLYSTESETVFANNPEFRKLYIEFFQGALRSQKEGRVLPPSEFHPAELKAKMQDLLAKSPNLSATDTRILQEALDNLADIYDDVRTVNTAQERISKTRKQEKRDLYTLESDDFSKSAFGGEGRSSAVARNFSETLNKLTKIKDPKARRKEQAIAAEQALKDSQAIISEAENELKTLEANKADSHQILTKQGQIARMREAEFEYRKYIKENDAQERKRQLQVLGFDLEAAKDAVATAKAIWSKSTGLNTEEKTYKEYEAKILAQQEVEDRINALKLIDNPDEETALEAVKRSRTSEKTKRGVERNSFRKNIEDRAKNAKISNEEARARQALEDKKREQDRFFKELENKDKFVKMQEEAERRQAKARAYIPLDSGSMFDTLNADEKKAAQAKANATGVSQEYSAFGQAANRFARQAARFDNQQLEKNLIQRKLANEVGALALLQQKERNINQEDYTKLVEKEAKLKAELKVLEANAANSRLDQDKEALERKQKEYDLTRDQILAAQNYEETLKEKIEERKNTIENLKETLQALNDQYDLMDTTLTAGVQSMTSGLSSIFSDWASGVIKNTDDVKEAFRSLGQSVLQSMAKVVSDKIAQQFMGFLLNGLGSAFGSKATSSAPLNFGEAIVGQVPVLSQGLALPSTGGLITPTGVKHFARGGEVMGTNIGRDSVPALLQPNEYVVQRSAVQALGTDFMQNLNNVTAGSLRQGAANLGGAKPMVQNVMKASPPVNVYVVSPEQQRQMGQEDVVVALQDDILRGGTTKKLIKAVISGEV